MENRLAAVGADGQGDAETARDKRYAEVLVSHIDRLNDPDEGDPLERIVKDLTDAYDRVASADTPLQRLRTYYRFHGLEPWPVPGTRLWSDEPVNAGDVAREAIVQSCFEGSDDWVYCVLEMPGVERSPYVVRRVLFLKASATGETFFAIAMRNSKFALQFSPRNGPEPRRTAGVRQNPMRSRLRSPD